MSRGKHAREAVWREVRREKEEAGSGKSSVPHQRI